eukprot:jgi/Mesen1/8515/ME000480S07870
MRKAGFKVKISGSEDGVYFSCKVDMPPFLFWKKQGSKTIHVDNMPVELCWDCSYAKFGLGPEPLEGFYIALLHNSQCCLLIGDLQKEALKKLRVSSICDMSATLISKREHLYGTKDCRSRAKFSSGGQEHHIAVDCCRRPETPQDPYLVVRVDGEPAVIVKHLLWQFRGSQVVYITSFLFALNRADSLAQMIHIDGVPVEVSWDMHNWLFNTHQDHAVFLLQAKPESPAEQSSHREHLAQACSQSARSMEQMWVEHDANEIYRSEVCRDEEQRGFALTMVAWRHDLRKVALECL